MKYKAKPERLVANHQLDFKVIHPKDGDVIIIYHPNPQDIEESVSQWASALQADCMVVMCEPGRDITLLDEAMMNKMGWVRKGD